MSNHVYNINQTIMPNHVYNVISVEEKYADKLKEITEVGLCMYYKPMPKEIELSRSPVRVVSEEEYQKALTSREVSLGLPITVQMQDDLIKKYGFDNWYDWSIHNWGTKWRVYDKEYDNGRYSFSTAWSPPSDSIIEMLAKDIPDFSYCWEEEQGYGHDMLFMNGKKVEDKYFETTYHYDE
jgi:hypothetical protein